MMPAYRPIGAACFLALGLTAAPGGIQTAAAEDTAAARPQPAAATVSQEVAATRQLLDALKADPELAAMAPEALIAAEQAVAAAERPQPDSATAAYTAFMATRKTQTAMLEAAARRDDHIRNELSARLDRVRHGNDSITTLAGDVVGATPPKLQLMPIAAAGPTSSTPPSAAAASVPTTTVPMAAAAGPQPLLALDNRDFDKNGALSPAAQRAIKRLLPTLFAELPPQPIVIAMGGSDKQSERRASAVRGYLLAEGIPGWRLVIRSFADTGTVPSGGVALFGRAPKAG
jgi:hypothetical protein